MSSSLGDFGKLPLELRNEIFLLVVQEKVHIIEPFPVLPLSQTSQAIRSEVLPIFHEKGQFQYTTIADYFQNASEMSQLRLITKKRQAKIQSRGIPSPVLHHVEIVCRTTWICRWEMSLTIERKKGEQVVAFPARIMMNGKDESWLRDDFESKSRNAWNVIRVNTEGRNGVSLEEILGIAVSMYDAMRGVEMVAPLE